MKTNAGFWVPTLSAGSAVTVVALPAFLVGAFAPAIKNDLGIGATGLGVLFSIGALTAAASLQLGGSLADRAGARRGIRVGLMLTSVGALALGLLAESLVVAAAAFVITRAGGGICQPAANTLISDAVPTAMRGRAMGYKHAAVPFAVALAGFSVPTLGDALGWRGVMVLLAFMVVPVWLAQPHVAVPTRTTPAARRELWTQRHLRMGAIAGGFAGASVSTVVGFLTVAVVARGFSEAAAGLLLTAGAVVMILARIGWGFLADRRPFDRFRAAGLLLAAGSTSYVLLAVGSEASMIAGTILAFGVGWSWPGLLMLGLIEQHPNEPGTATAIVQTGIRLGVLVSPLAFGVVVDQWGFRPAWLLSFGYAMIASVLMLMTSASVRARTA